MTGTLRRATVMVVAAAAVAMGMTVAVTGTAQAAPKCRATSHLHEGNEYNEVPTTAPNNWEWRCELGPGDGYVGDQARAVYVLQRALIQCYGQNIGDADSKYGERTREGVRNVQRFHNQFGAGLVVDGLYGPNTAAVMEFVNSQNRCWT